MGSKCIMMVGTVFATNGSNSGNIYQKYIYIRPVTNTYFTIRIFDHQTIRISEAWPKSTQKRPLADTA